MSQKKSKSLNAHDEVVLNDETSCLTQQAMADLFGAQHPTTTINLKNIYESGELDEESASSVLEHAGETGHTYPTKYYNLDAFLEFNEQDLLTHARKLKMEVSQKLAAERCDEFDTKTKEARSNRGA